MLSRAFKPSHWLFFRTFATNNELKDTFRFPSHKAYFNNEYYNVKYKGGPKAQGMTMNTYKQLFQEPQKKRDDWDHQEDNMEVRIKKYLEKSDPQTMMKTTKEIVKRKALNREFMYTEEERESLIDNQYGNYDKYLKNFTEVKDVPLPKERDESILERLHSVKEKLKTPDTEPNGESVNMKYQKMAQYIWGSKANAYDLPKLKPPEEWSLDDDELELFNSLLRKRLRGENAILGRVSPYAKQEIYSLYRQGWNVQDLSHKFGILIDRVKAIILHRQIFWDEVYPRLGETAVRMGMEIELLYGQQFAFIDYGKDLGIMASNESTLQLEKISRRMADRELVPAEKERIKQFYHKKRPNLKYTFIPEKFIGSIQKGYMIKSFHVWRGEGKVKPTEMFKGACRYAQKENQYLLPERVVANLNKGPKKASKGYKPQYRKN